MGTKNLKEYMYLGQIVDGAGNDIRSGDQHGQNIGEEEELERFENHIKDLGNIQGDMSSDSDSYEYENYDSEEENF